MIRRKFFAALLLVLAAAGFAGDAGWLVVNISSSAPAGVYIAAAGPPAAGDYVVFDWGRRPRLLKKVVAVAGDEYVVTGDTVVVAGEEFRRQSDVPATPGPGRHVIPAGHVWLAGQGNDSFDSRYFGPVSVEKCRPVRLVFRF
ncbi:S26 family signal peptidase [Sporolituus thermophilus]|uniref:Type IV secretory pathway, protease TraF n=1 Tax=Sporolituus thermophilus DSM 23256 TaxID=1123285 RepID=A0A1G7MHD3_9FIRM|nr:S26 family signal peptidase [Sporolituus thermophilus]SDF61141.1 Type IV secretory pathway, protease TraF [Sporolituus thermophilus DSM 23256]